MDEMNEPTFLYEADIEEVFLWWPRRCRLSDRILWLTFAVRGRLTYLDVNREITKNRPYYEDRYYGSEEFIMMRLKNGY